MKGERKEKPLQKSNFIPAGLIFEYPNSGYDLNQASTEEMQVWCFYVGTGL